MILCAVLNVVFCTVYSSAQDTYVEQRYNISDYPSRLNNRAPMDYEPPQSNLWLISTDDPIPVKFNQKIDFGDQTSSYQTGRVRTGDFGMRLTHPTASENGRSANNPSQAQSAFVYPAPTYDKILTTENRRQGVDINEVQGRNSASVLLELPIQITDGLWTRPQSQLLQQIVRGRQNTDGENVSFKFDGDINPKKQDEIQTVYVPITELTSRLPTVELSSQYGQNVPQEQYYDAPYQTTSRNLRESSAENEANQSDVNDQEIWLINDDQNHASENNFKSDQNSVSPTLASEIGGDVHKFELLTSEDIELLERLGILSSLVIEPFEPENITNNFTSFRNSQREYEGEPALIDNGGQSYLRSSEREDSSKLGDVVLFDIPQFTTSEYHSNMPENIGGVDSYKPSTPELIDVPENATHLNGSSNLPNNTDLSDRQILKILQLLSLNAGDFYNLSSSIPVKVDSKSEESTTDNSNNSTFKTSTLNAASTGSNEKLRVLDAPRVASQSAPLPPNSEKRPPVSEQSGIPPTVSNGRIQPRLLEMQTSGDNRIIEGLLNKTKSENKLDILEKLIVQPKPYLFGFKQDDGNGTLQHRDEKSDASGIVKGTYGYRDALGVYRNVSYIADNNGFHAVVKTNEPGTVSHNTADVVFMSETPPLAALVKMMAYRRFKDQSNITETP